MIFANQQSVVQSILQYSSSKSFLAVLFNNFQLRIIDIMATKRFLTTLVWKRYLSLRLIQALVTR